MRAWQRALLGALLVGAVAAAGIALNFRLLGLTQDTHDPVGQLSPRAVFTDRPATATTAITTTPARSDSGSSPRSGRERARADDD